MVRSARAQLTERPVVNPVVAERALHPDDAEQARRQTQVEVAQVSLRLRVVGQRYVG